MLSRSLKVNGKSYNVQWYNYVYFVAFPCHLYMYACIYELPAYVTVNDLEQSFGSNIYYSSKDKNLAIANRSRVSCINTNNNTMTLKSGLEVTQGH